jgi:hypothetical protein
MNDYLSEAESKENMVYGTRWDPMPELTNTHLMSTLELTPTHLPWAWATICQSRP